MILLGKKHENGPRRAREGYKKLPGGRGFVLPEYGPVASHGDPIHGQFYEFVHCILCIVYDVLCVMYLLYTCDVHMRIIMCVFFV